MRNHHSAVGAILLWLCVVGCGRTAPSMSIGVSKEGAETSSSTTGGPQASTTHVDPGTAETTDVVDELSLLPRLPPHRSERTAPNCLTPSSVQFSDATYGARAARLIWDRGTGECVLDAADRNPKGMLGILTLRQKGDRVALSAIGQWQMHASKDLNLSDVPPDTPITVYPFLGDWQFVATVEHNRQLVKLLDFAYLRGKGQETGGQRDDLEDRAPSEFVPPTLCGSQPQEGETR